MFSSMDWSPIGQAWTWLLRSFAEVALFGEALSIRRPLKREAGTTTDDPHHPARTLPFNLYTIYGVIASIRRYILRLLMQKTQNYRFRTWLFSKKSPNSTAWQVETSRFSRILLLLCESFCLRAVQVALPFGPSRLVLRRLLEGGRLP